MLIVICQLDMDIVIPQQCLNDAGLMFKDDLLEEVICKLGFKGGIVIGEKNGIRVFQRKEYQGK